MNIGFCTAPLISSHTLTTRHSDPVRVEESVWVGSRVTATVTVSLPSANAAMLVNRGTFIKTTKGVSRRSGRFGRA